MSITDVTNHFGLAQPTVSNHVKQLREAGVVASRTEGKRRQLTVRREVVDEIISALNEIFDLQESRLQPGPDERVDPHPTSDRQARWPKLSNLEAPLLPASCFITVEA